MLTICGPGTLLYIQNLCNGHANAEDHSLRPVEATQGHIISI